MAKPFSAVTLALLLAFAGSAATLAEEAKSKCSSEQSHQFDFWIGEWNVYAGEKLAGTNSIRPILDGCVLQESWNGAQGGAGSSFNFYNPQSGKWQQFWVRRNGTTLELSGEYADSKMVLSGDSTAADGTAVQNRITWYDNSDGSVRQQWQQSKNGGEGWVTIFDGLYKKKR